MPPETPDPGAAAPENLKDSLYKELGAQFSERLSADAGMPGAAKAALADLLAKPAVISADILAALATEDPEQKEARDE